MPIKMKKCERCGEKVLMNWKTCAECRDEIRNNILDKLEKVRMAGTKRSAQENRRKAKRIFQEEKDHLKANNRFWIEQGIDNPTKLIKRLGNRGRDDFQDIKEKVN